MFLITRLLMLKTPIFLYIIENILYFLHSLMKLFTPLIIWCRLFLTSKSINQCINHTSFNSQPAERAGREQSNQDMHNRMPFIYYSFTFMILCIPIYLYACMFICSTAHTFTCSYVHMLITFLYAHMHICSHVHMLSPVLYARYKYHAIMHILSLHLFACDSILLQYS